MLPRIIKELNFIRLLKRKSVSNKGVGTESDSFEIVKVCTYILHQHFKSVLIVIFQHLEDVILFKNQELSEFNANLKARDEKISMLENIWFRSQENKPQQVRRSLTSYSTYFDFSFVSE